MVDLGAIGIALLALALLVWFPSWGEELDG